MLNNAIFHFRARGNFLATALGSRAPTGCVLATAFGRLKAALLASSAAVEWLD